MFLFKCIISTNKNYSPQICQSIREENHKHWSAEPDTIEHLLLSVFFLDMYYSIP